MTEKRLFVGRKKCEDRFTIITNYDGEIGVKENRSGDVLVLKHSDLNAQQFVAQLVVFLNDQNQAIVDLFDGNKYWLDKASEKIDELEKENEQLKSDLGYWRTLAQSLAKGNNIGKFEMMDKEVTIDLNELDINIQNEIIFKSDLNKWIEKKMDYYEGMMEKTDGCNYVNAKGHLDMLIKLKEWIKQR